MCVQSNIFTSYNVLNAFGVNLRVLQSMADMGEKFEYELSIKRKKFDLIDRLKSNVIEQIFNLFCFTKNEKNNANILLILC